MKKIDMKKETKKMIKIWVAVVLGGVLLFSSAIICVTAPWSFVAIGSILHSAFSPAPPKPEIKYGEFPIKVEYEINGERKVIEDTVICEYDGLGLEPWIGGGKCLKWKERLASGNERLTLLKISEDEEIYYPMGTAGYYLGSGNAYFVFGAGEDNWKNACNIKQLAPKTTSGGLIEADELYEIYGIKIISWEPSEPIVNTFK